MTRAFTPEEREKIKGLIVEFVRLNGRGTIRQLSDEIGVSHASVGRLCMELAASGDVYNSGYGVFPSEQARKDWQNARKKLSRAKSKKPVVVVQTLSGHYQMGKYGATTDATTQFVASAVTAKRCSVCWHSGEGVQRD